jgi:hypothetical protein
LPIQPQAIGLAGKMPTRGIFVYQPGDVRNSFGVLQSQYPYPCRWIETLVENTFYDESPFLIVSPVYVTASPN